jgi:hypothetical protein
MFAGKARFRDCHVISGRDAMHIHGTMMNAQGANLASISSGERAAAAQQAAEVRKRLLRNAQIPGGDTSPEEATLIGNWLNVRHNQSLADDEYHASSGKNSDLG